MKKTLVFLTILAIVATFQPTPTLLRVTSQPEQYGTCLRFTSDHESCLECIENFHLFEGKCYLDIHGCSEYVFGNICRRCETGYILVNNECCDKHCMGRIFKNYQEEGMEAEESNEEKVKRLTIEGYETTVTSLTKTFITTSSYKFISTTNQILSDLIRYTIKIQIGSVRYLCVADYEMTTKKVSILEFRPQQQVIKVSEVVITEQQLLQNEQAKLAVQFINAKYGLRIIGMSLQRISLVPNKYGMEFKFIYLSEEKSYMFQIVVTNKKYTYLSWMEERTDVQEVRNYVKESVSVVKIQKEPSFQIIKGYVSNSSHVSTSQIEVQKISKLQDNTYSYKYVNTETNKVYEQVTRVDPVTKKVQILQSKEVISQDLKLMKLPESPEKKIITKTMISETPEVRSVIKYLEEVQPSLATKQITNAQVEVIGETRKITLMQKKNDQSTRVVVLYNQKTNEFKLIDESLVVVSPPGKLTIQTTKEGQTKLITNNLQKMVSIDKQTVTIVQKINQKLPQINLNKTEGVEKVEGNLVNTYTFLVSGNTYEAPKQQVTVIQNKETKEVKVIDYEEINTQIKIEPIERPVVIIPESEYQTKEIKQVLYELQIVNEELKDTTLTIKEAEAEETKFVTKYTMKVETKEGLKTVTATVPHDVTKKVTITSVNEVRDQVVHNTTNYVTKVTVDKSSGVKTTVTSKPEDIKVTFVNTSALVTLTGEEAKTSHIESIVRKEYENMVTETVIIKTNKNNYVQAVFAKNKTSGEVTNYGEQVIEIQPVQGQPILPVVSTTTITEAKFKQVVKTNQVLKNITAEVIKFKPEYENITPVTTEIEDVGPKKIIVVVFVVKNQEEKERIIAEYTENTQQTIIREQTKIPIQIKPIFIEKDIAYGEVKVTSNSIEEIQKENTQITTVIDLISHKMPVVKENPVSFQVTTNPISTTYQISAVDKVTKKVVQVSVNYDETTNEVVWNDIIETPEEETILVKPAPKPSVILTPQETQITVVQNVIEFVKESTSSTSEILEVKKVENLMVTTYNIKVNGTQGVETVTVTVGNTEEEQITLIDIIPEKPVVKPAVIHIPSVTTTSVTSTSITQITSNEVSEITANKYVKIVRQYAETQESLLKGSKITCFYEDKYETVVFISYLAQTTWGTVSVAGFVNIQTNEVQIIHIPSILEEGGLSTTDSVCGTRQIEKFDNKNLESSTNSEILGFVQYITSHYQFTKVDRLRVQQFNPQSIVFVLTFIKEQKIFRTVIAFSFAETIYVEVEGPVEILRIKPISLEQKVDEKGGIIYISNSIEQIKTVDQSVEVFIEKLSTQVQKVITSEVINIISQPHENNNQYTVFIKEDNGMTMEVKAIFKKETQTIQIVKVDEKPQVLIKPAVKPAVIVPEEEIKDIHFVNVVTTVNQKLDGVSHIETSKITKVEKMESTVVTTYNIEVSTPEGPEFFVVSENNEGVVQVIDHRPVVTEFTKILNVVKPVHTELTVDVVTGVETQITNDTKIITSNPQIVTVVKELQNTQVIDQKSTVTSVVVKTSEKKIQTNIVTTNPLKPTENIIIVAVTDKQSGKVTVISEKVVTVEEGVTQSVETAVVETIYTSTLMEQSIKKNDFLQKAIEKVTSLHTEVSGMTPTKIVTEVIGEVTICQVTYEEKGIISTIITNEETGQIEELEVETIPVQIKPIILETQVNEEGTTIINTNTIEQVTQYNENFNEILEEMKIAVPIIMTEQILGIRLQVSQDTDAPQKVYVVFNTEDQDKISQISVIYNQQTHKTSIIDVQTVSKQEIIYHPEELVQVKLSEQEVVEEAIFETIVSSPDLLTEGITSVSSVVETKTAFTKIFTTEAVNTIGEKYIIRLQKDEEGNSVIVDKVKEPLILNKETITKTTVNPHNGIMTTFTNDVKVMKEEKTFQKCVDYLEKEFQMSQLGFELHSECISRLQRIIQHHVRYLKGDVVYDFRINVDQRTGSVSLVESHQHTVDIEEINSIEQFEVEPLVISNTQIPSAVKQYPVIESSKVVVEQADYTFKGIQPTEIHITHFEHSVQLVLIYKIQGKSPIRVVVIGQQKPSSVTTAGKASYILKVVDLTTLSEEIEKIETTTLIDSYGRTKTITNNIKVLEQNNQEYVEVVKFASTSISALEGTNVNSVEITKFSKANEYTIITKKGEQIIEVRVSHRTEDNTNVLLDFRSQSTKIQVQKVPIQPIQAIITIVEKQQFEVEYVTEIKDAVISQMQIEGQIILESFQIRQNPRMVIYEMEAEIDEILTSIEVHKNPITEEIVIFKYRPEYIIEENTHKEEVTTIVETNLVSGQEVTITNDTVLLEGNTHVIHVVQKLVDSQIFENVENTHVVEAIISKSSTKVHMTIVVEEETNVNENHVIVVIEDIPTGEVIIVGEQIITDEELQEIEIEDLQEQILDEEIINGVVFQTIVKTDKVIQNVFTSVQQTHTNIQTTDVHQVQVINVGGVFVYEFVTSDQTITVTTQGEEGQITEIAVETVPEVIVPIFIETTVNQYGHEVIYASGASVTVLVTQQQHFETVLDELSQDFEVETGEIETVTSTQTSTGVMYMIIVESQEQFEESYQLDLFYEYSTGLVIDMGTTEIPEVEVQEQIEEESTEVIEPVPVQEWTTNPQVEEVITVVQTQSHISQVTDIKVIHNQLVTIYEVTGDNKVVTLVVDAYTQEVEVVDEEVIIPEVQVPIRPSVISVVVNQVTGIKETITNNVEQIKNDQYTQIIYTQVTSENIGLEGSEIVEIVQTDLGTQVEQITIFQSQTSISQVTTFINKQTSEAIIVESVIIDEPHYIQPVEYTITELVIEEQYQESEFFRLVIQYIQAQYTQFSQISPKQVDIEEHETYIMFYFVYQVGTVRYRIVIKLVRATKQIEVITAPTEIGIIKPVVIETTYNEYGRVTIISNSVQQIITVDTNFQVVTDLLQQEVTVNYDDVKEIEVVQTFQGAIYTFTSQTQQGTSQVTVVYNSNSGTILVTDIEEEPIPSLIKPAPRPILNMTLEQIQDSQEIHTVTTFLQEEYSHILDFTYEEISSVQETVTAFGVEYHMGIAAPAGNFTFTVLKPVDGSGPRVVTYESSTKPLIIVKPAVVTSEKVDEVTGQTIIKTNDTIVIKRNPVIKTVTQNLISSGIMDSSSQISSVITKTSTNKVYTTLLVTSETENHVITTVVDKETNEVTVIAEEQVTEEEVQEIESGQITIQEVTQQVVYPQNYFTQTTITKDHKIVTIVEQVQQTYPQLHGLVPIKVVSQHIGNVTVCQCDYDDISITITQADGQEQIQVISSEEIPEDFQVITYEVNVNEEGEETVTSNSVDKVSVEIPLVRPAVIEVSQIVGIKQEQIVSISVIKEKNQYNLVTVNKQTGSTVKVQFVYDEKAQEKVLLIDVQETTSPTPTEKPHEPVYVVCEIVEEPQILTTIKKLNSTSSTLKSLINEVTEVKKSSLNLVNEYKVTVTTKDNEQAVLTLDKNPETGECQVIDIIKYVEPEVEPVPIEIIETINPVTQVVETTYTTEDTFKFDESYEEIKEYLKEETFTYQITSVVKEKYGANNEYNILLKSENLSPQQIELNINNFNKEITVLQNKTIISKETVDKSPFDKQKPETVELTLSHNAQDRIQIISKLSTVKNINEYETITNMKSLEKDETFVHAVSDIKNSYSSLLKDSTIVKVLKKQNLDEIVMRAFFLNSQDNNKDLYEVDIRINPISGIHEILEFSKVNSNEPKSQLNLGADIAYGYVVMDNFAGNQNVEFIITYLKEHYNFIENAVIQSVEFMSLCDGKGNYKIFLKNNLEIVKFIVFFEENYKRVLQVRSYSFEMGGVYQTMDLDTLIHDGYFKDIDKYLKEKHAQIAEGSSVIHVEKKDIGEEFSYRIIYANKGKTFHSSIKMHKQYQDKTEEYWNEIIEIPIIKQDPLYEQKEQYTVLRINDLAHNPSFENVHTEILSQFGSFLQNAQMLGAKQKTQMFKILYTFYFLNNDDRYSIEAEIDSSTQKITVASEPELVSLTSGYSYAMDSASNDVIEWIQNNDPDLRSGVVMEIGRKPELFGIMYKVTFKLPAKYVTIVVLKEAGDYKILSEEDVTALDSTNASEFPAFPKPVVLSGATFKEA